MPSELSLCGSCGRLIAPETVAISAAELAALVYKSGLYDRLALSARSGRRRSPIDGNAELAAFLVMAAPSMTLAELATACEAHFGQKAPSRSAIQRFLKRSLRPGGVDLFPPSPG